MTTSLRLAFMGTPDFAVSSLRALLDAGHEVVCVYSQPPRPAGRGQKERPSPVQALAVERGITVRTPRSLKGAEDQADFAALKLDAAVVAAYGLILPPAILASPRLGCLNVHASLLPRWRGAAPIQRAILAGDAESGVTIMQMDEGLDTGGMLLGDQTAIKPMWNAGDLHDVLAAMGAKLIVAALDARAGGATATPQPGDGITYAAKIDRAETRIDWTKSAADVVRQVRAFAPVPGTWFERNGERIKVLNALACSGQRAPGTLLNDTLTVACGDGAVMLTRLQRAGRGPLDAGDFLRGYVLPAGTLLA